MTPRHRTEGGVSTDGRSCRDGCTVVAARAQSCGGGRSPASGQLRWSWSMQIFSRLVVAESIMTHKPTHFYSKLLYNS